MNRIFLCIMFYINISFASENNIEIFVLPQKVISFQGFSLMGFDCKRSFLKEVVRQGDILVTCEERKTSSSLQEETKEEFLEKWNQKYLSYESRIFKEISYIQNKNDLTINTFLKEKNDEYQKKLGEILKKIENFKVQMKMIKFRNQKGFYELRKIEWKAPSSGFYVFNGNQDLGTFYSSKGMIVACLLDYQKEFFYLLKDKKLDIEGHLYSFSYNPILLKNEYFDFYAQKVCKNGEIYEVILEGFEKIKNLHKDDLFKNISFIKMKKGEE